MAAPTTLMTAAIWLVRIASNRPAMKEPDRHAAQMAAMNN